MAALVQLVFKKTGQQFSTKCPISGLVAVCKLRRNYSNNTKKNVVETGPQIDSLAESLASKGYLRSQKPYEPPANVAGQIRDLCSAAKVNAAEEKKPLNQLEKFTLLTECFKQFKHGVPNSQLHEINNIDDVIAFYQTSVNTTLPLDAMKTMELPSNLHIQHEYVRFNPETDTMFGGQTAFPKSSTLVTGLKAKKKYKGHTAKQSWP